MALGLSLLSLPALAASSDVSSFLKTSSQTSVPSVTNAKNSTLTKAPVRNWTIMVYMNAKNNLQAAGLYNMAQMEAVGSTDKVNVVTELGRYHGGDGDVHDDGDWSGIHRYLVTKTTIPDNVNQSTITLTSPVLYSADSGDMGDYKEVESFVTWSEQNFPARHYMLILWDHGAGWMDPQKKTQTAKALASKSTQLKAISFDDQTGNFIGTVEIGKIARDIGGVDVMGYDACLMQMAEVVGEVGSSAKISLGSEETVPGYGIDYTGFLTKATASPSAGAAQMATFAADAFHDFYQSNYSQIHQNATMSVVDDSALTGFGNVLDAWTAVAMQVKDINALKTARDGVLRFDEFGDQDAQRVLSTYGDAYNFFQLVAANTQDQGLKAASQAVVDYITQALVIKSTAVGADGKFDYANNAHGISMNIPRMRADITTAQLEDKYFGNKYTDFAFTKSNTWYTFYQWMTANVPATKPATAPATPASSSGAKPAISHNVNVGSL
jgi:hypothetical protein